MPVVPFVRLKARDKFSSSLLLINLSLSEPWEILTLILNATDCPELSKLKTSSPNHPVIIHLAVNKLLKNFSRLKKPHTKHRRCKCIRRLRIQRAVAQEVQVQRRLRIQRAVVRSLKAKKKKASRKERKDL
jgi:hypothetical protein